MKYSIGGKINANGDLLSYFESLDDKLSDIEKRRNIALKLNLDVEGRKEAEDLLEKFDEKSKNGMNNYFVTQAKGVRDLTKAWDKLDLIKNDLEYEEDAAKKASLQNRYDKQVNAIVRQANAYQALGYQVNDNIQKILEFSKAQEAVLQKRTGGQYQYTVQNFKDLFDVMKDLMPLLEKSDGLSKNLFHMSPQLSDVKEIEERAKKAEQYIKNVYEKYGDALLPDETQREVVRNYATTQGYSRVHKRITGQAASYSPEFNDAINNIRFSNSPIEKEIFEQQVLRVESDYEKVLTALRKDAQKVSEAAQDDLALSYENLVNEINESIQNMSQKLDFTKSRISFLELEQQKKLTNEWGSFEGSRPRFSETGDIAGAYITNEAFTEANKLYDSLFEKIEQGAITSDEAINMMAEDLFKAVSKGEATPFLSDDVMKLQEEIDELKAKIVSLSEALQEAKSEAQDFANVANGTYENNLDLENQIDRLLRRIDEQQEEIDNLTRENDYLRDNQGNGYGDGYGDGYGSYSDDYVEGLQSTLQHLTDRIDSLEGLLSSQGGQIGDGQGDGKAPFGECCAILSGIKETLGSINFQGLNAMPEDVTSIRNVLNEISGSVDGLKDILASSDGQIAVTNVTNLGIGNEDDPEARQRYAELMDAYASVFNPRKTSRSFKDEAGNVVNKISEKISVTFDEIASAIITNLPTVGARYGNNVSAFKEIYSLERIQARPLQDRIALLTDLLGWIKELSKVDLGQELNSVIRKNSKGFPELTSESISNNQLGFANSVEAILKTLQEIARQVGGIFNALNAGATNDIPNLNADFLTDRGQILKDLFSKIATTGKGAISSRASNVANIKDFLNQFNAYGNGEWSLDEFARINDISKKNLDILKQYNEELFGQKELVEDIAEIQEEIAQIHPDSNDFFLTDEHGNLQTFYRGTRGGTDAGAFYSERFGGKTFWAKNPAVGASYGDPEFPQRLHSAHLSLKHPFVYKGEGRQWNQLPFFGVDENASVLSDAYEYGIQLLKQVGAQGNDSELENKLKTLSKEWNDVREALLHKAFGDIESVREELLDGNNVFSNQYDWLDELRVSVDEIGEFGRLFKGGLGEALQNKNFGIKNTKQILDYVEKTGMFDAMYFKDIFDVGGGGSIRIKKGDKNFITDIVVPFNQSDIKHLATGPSTDFMTETWAKSIIEEFLYSYGKHDLKPLVSNNAGGFETRDMSQAIQDFRTEVNRDALLKTDSVVQYFASLPDEIGQKILDVLHSDSIDTEKYSNEIENFITDYLMDILEYGGGVEEAYNKIKELDPDIETNSAYRKAVRFGLNQASSFLNDEDLKSLARDELKNSVALQIAPAFQNMQQLLSFGGAKEIRQALRDDGTIQTNLLSSLKEIIVQEIYDVWSDYLKSAPVSDMDVTNEAESEILEKREKVQQESIEDLKEEKELRQEINDLVEQKNALEKEEPQQGAENAEKEKESIKEINSLLEEQTSLEKESNSLEEADVGQDNAPITSVIEAIKEKTEAFEKEKEAVDEVVEAEKQKLKELRDSVGKVTKAVKAKTDAFDKEGKVVVDTMQEEKEAILSLPSVITTPNGEVINPQSRNASSAASFNTPPLLPGGSANADDNPQDQFPEWEKITLRFIKAIESFDNMVEKIPEKIMDEEIHYQDVHGQAYRTRISDVVSGNLNIGGRQISLMDRVDAINAMPNGTASEMQAKLDEMQSLIPVINAYTSSIKEMIKSHGELADSLSMKKIQNRIQDYLSTNTNLTTEQRAELLRLKQALEDAFDPQNNNISMTKDEFRELLGNLELAEANIRRTGREGKNVFQKMAEQVGHLNERWIGQLLSFHDIIRYIRTMYTEIKNIDTALIELKKVTDGLTMERLNISLENSLDTARKLGSEVTEVINTTADWARLGYGIEDAEKLAEVTTLFKNVGDNMTTDAASEYLISTLKGFEMVPEEALSIVDKFNEVANNFAIDTAGIGTALERSSASFNAANTNLSESIALVTTANAVVQNPESVGTTFKTLSARIRGAKTELEELGEEEDSFTKSTSKLRDLVKGMTGFDIMEDEDTFKSIYEILLGIGEEWDNLTDVERASLGEALAGKRNSNVLFAIMNNIEDLEKAYETAENAAGSATKEQENYQKSIQYSVDVFKAELSELYTKVLNSDDVKKFVDLMAQGLSYVVKIADKVPTIAILGGMFGLSHIAGNSTRMGELGKFLDAIKSATKVLASGGGTQAWKTLSSSLVDIQKVGLKEGQTTPLIQLLSNPSSIASLAKTAGLIAVITTAYIGLAKAIDSAVDSIEDIEKRMDETSGKIQEYDSKLTELYARLDEINSMDMSAYSQTQQQNLQDEAKHVKELANQYENLKIAYEEGYAKDRETLWWGETKEVPVVASAEKMLSGDFKGAWETDLSSGLYRGDNKLLQFLINKALMTNLVGQFIPDEENNKSENLDKSIKDYEKLVQKIEDARERQIDSLEKVNSGEYDKWARNYFEKSASKTESELIKLNKERSDIISNILEDQADLMEMRDSIKSKSPELFTEEDVLTLEWIEKELSKIGVFLDKVSEAPDYGKKLASVLVGSEVEYAARSGKTREDLANTWLGQLNEEELKKFGELDLTGVTISSLEELKDLLIETAEATNVLSYSFEGLGALLSSGEMATSSKSWAEVKNDLTGLAQAGKLDENTLKEYEYYDTILQALGLSADEADAQISEMIDSINKMAQQNAVDVLNKYKNGVDSLADAYEKYRKGDFIDASTLSAIQDTFGDLDSYHEFEEAVMSGEENLQQYFDNIVTEYAIQESALGELTEANKDWVKQQLIASGITEASADKAIKQSLERKESIEGEIRATLELMNAEVAENSGRKDLIVSTENLDKLTTKEITLLMQEANMSGTAAQAVALFALKKELAKDASLRNQDDINYLLQLINLADIGSAKVSELKYKLEHQQDYENAKKNADALEENFYKTYGKDSTKWNSGARQYWQEVEKARQNADNALKQIDTLSKDVIGEINKQHPELDYTLDLDLDYGGAVDAASEAGSAAAENFKETLDKILAMYDAELDAGVETFKNYVNKSRAIIEQYYQEGKITASEYYDYIANLYEKQVSEYDKVISAVQRKIQEQIDSLDKEKESIEESYNLQIEEIQKKIDALQEENEEIDRNMALSRAQYQLARAQHQRTRLMYSESRGFYYEADLQGIADAQENVRKAQLDKTVSDLQRRITTLQESMKRETDAIDEQIKSLNELSEAWGEVSSTLQHSIEDMRAEEILGKDWEQQIFADRQKILEDFTNQYVALQQAQKDAYLAARQAELDYQPNPTGNSGGNPNPSPAPSQPDNKPKSGGEYSNPTADKAKVGKGYSYNGKTYASLTEAQAAKQADVNGAYQTAYDKEYAKWKNKPIPESVKNSYADNAGKKAKEAANKKQIKALFQGADSAKAGDTLVGELGTEIVLDKNKGKATIVDSPTLMKMKGGEKVFNAEETEKILKSKYVPLKNLNPKKFAMLHSFANGTSSPLQNAIAAQAVGIASGLKSGLNPALSTGAGQTINQTFNVSLPNITDSSKASDLFREFEQLQRKATQFFN